MKSNIKIKVIAIFMILLIIYAFTVKTIADGNDNLTDFKVYVRAATSENGDEIAQVELPTNSTVWFKNQGKSHNLFKDNPVYCIYSTCSAVGNCYTLNSSEPVMIDVNSQQAYVLGLDDDYISKSDSSDFTDWYGTKQNLIWYYYDIGPNGTIGYRNKDSYRDGVKLGKGEISYLATSGINTNAIIELNRAEAYENYCKNQDIEKKLKLNVESQESNIIVSWNKLFLPKKYEVYVNNALYQSYDNEEYIINDTTNNENVNIKSIVIPTNQFSEGISSIKVVAKDAEIARAGYYTLTSGNRQPIIATSCEKKDVEESIILGIDVSLQKYITKVNGNDLNSTQTGLLDRKNTYTTSSEQETGANRVVSKSEENNMKTKTENNYKYNNIVNIEAGDEVTYRIHVYNNSNVVAKTVVVRDYLDNVNNCEIVKITKNGGNEDIKASLQNTENPRLKQYTLENLEGGAEVYFDVTIKYTDYVANIVTNTAWIYSTDPSNDTSYRTLDRDYIKMKPLNVSLQKYIARVNNNNLTTNETGLLDRKNTYTRSDEKEAGANKIVSKSEEDKMKSAGTYKYNNIVSIEAGDEVTYRIHVYNNSNVVAKKVIIRDYLDNVNNCEIIKITRDGGTEDIKAGLQNTDNPRLKQYTLENLAAGAETYFDVTIKFKDYIANVVTNTAWIYTTEPVNETEYRTLDRDYIKMKEYKVSLEKYISNPNNSALTPTRAGKAEYLTIVNGVYKDNTENDTKWTRHNTTKFDNPVTVSNRDSVTYTIRVRNDGETSVYIPSITDNLPDEVSMFEVLSAIKYSSNGQAYNENITAQMDVLQTNGESRVISISRYNLLPGEYILISVRHRVDASNMSLELYKNTAKITENRIINKNGITLIDTTPYNNEDSDYYQLNFRVDDVVISGKVWNDIAPDKDSSIYNGLYDENYEKNRLLKGIKVYLYRKTNNGETKVGETETDENGIYTFTENNVTGNIKGPVSSNKWSGIYYSYYVVFEYDGIKYVPSPDGKTFKAITDTQNYQNNSNAREKLNNESYNGSSSVESRTKFNDKFSTINKDGAFNSNGEKTSDIEYERHIGTINDGGTIKPYNPQSIHKYNAEMAMKSSTELFTLKDDNTFIDQIKHINVGLRGRQTFDLYMSNPEVTSVKMFINGKSVEYTDLMTGSKVTIRSSDVAEDTANIAKEVTEDILETNQNIRNSDKENINNAVLGGKQALVTYKFTITNQSRTDGTANKVINYYDNRYDIQRAYIGNDNLRIDTVDSGNGYKAAMITTNGKSISANDNMEIYVEYSISDLGVKNLKVNEEVKFYNMAEIYEYKTIGDNTEKEFVRGLIDSDSAPGSGSTEKVVLYPDDYDMTKVADIVVNENANRPSTVQYYFNRNELNKLKKEDDTNNKVLKFAIVGDTRTITGNVFEDNAIVDSNTRVKSGDGILNDGENKVGGMLVRLVELTTNKNPSEISESEGRVIADTTTDENGNYRFEGFKPGNYIIRFYYGNNKDTVLKNQISNNKNANSYNGEDYQATNNSRISNLDYWYLFNENAGISTGYDNESRRANVSQNVVNYGVEKMELLNKIRNNQTDFNGEVQSVAGETFMYSNTKPIVIDVEKRQVDGNSTKVSNMFAAYNVLNMNFGIARVPVTTIDLQKHIESFTIKDASGQNIIASAKLENGQWVKTGDTNIVPNEKFVVEIENNKLQGSKLEVKYNITAHTMVERDFKNIGTQNIRIAGLVDYIDNDLSYNESLGDNKKYWSAIRPEDIRFEDGEGTLDREKKIYTVAVTATAENPLLQTDNDNKTLTCPITLEKVLSSEDSTLQDIIQSNTDAYEYTNNVEISKLDYENRGTAYKDRIRIPESRGWYTILAGRQYDSAASEPLSIVPPFGENNSIMYYVIGAILLVVLAGGVVLIKKYAIKR